MARPRKTKSGCRIDPKTGKANTGRPTKFTPETINKLEQAFNLGCTDSEACCYAEVTLTAFYNFQKKTPGFLDRKNRMKEKPILLARQSLVKGVQEDSNLALKFLERKKKAEFSLRTETDITTQGEKINTPQLNLDGLTDEELKLLQKVLNKSNSNNANTKSSSS